MTSERPPETRATSRGASPNETNGSNKSAPVGCAGKGRRRRVVARSACYNRLSFPLLFNTWEAEGLDRHFDIMVRTEPLDVPPYEELTPEDVVLFSFMTPHLPEVEREIRFIAPQGPIIAGGGPHISGEQELAAEIGFHYLFAGPAEYAFPQFGRDLLDRLPPAPHVYRAPCDAGLLSAHIPISRYFREIPPLEIMRGCRWNCSYCTTGSSEVIYRDRRSIERYMDELTARGYGRLNFICPSALEYGAEKARTPNLEALEGLLSLTRARNFRFVEFGIFPSEIRPDSATRESLRLLKGHVSNRAVTLGAQSGDDARLKSLSRGHDAEHARRAVEWANDAGFLANLDFIVGYPDEDERETLRTMDFIREIQRVRRVRVFPHYFFPLSGSRLADRFPSPLSARSREFLMALHRNGHGEQGWLENESQTTAYFLWLRERYPHYYRKYR